MSKLISIIEPRNPEIARLVDQCARGVIPFNGLNSLCSQVMAMGYRTSMLNELVRIRERELEREEER